MSAEPMVFLVDDDDDVRASLRMFLSTYGLHVVDFTSAGQFLETVKADAEGCLLLDISMPDMTGLELQRELQARRTDLPVIFITGHQEIPLAVEAIKHGAVDFLQKPVDDGKLLDCIYRALEINQRDRAEHEQRRQYRALLEALTPREHDVLKYLLEGDMTKVIASKLGISTRTAELHRARIMKKMGCRTLAQLVHKVTTAGGGAGH